MSSFIKSRKSFPTFKAPSRKHCSSDNARKPKKFEKRVPKITLNLVDNVTSTLSKDGNWHTGFKDEDKSQDLLRLQQVQETLLKEKELLSKRHCILLELAKSKVEQLDVLEKERKQLLRIVRKGAKNCKRSVEKKT